MIVRRIEEIIDKVFSKIKLNHKVSTILIFIIFVFELRLCNILLSKIEHIVSSGIYAVVQAGCFALLFGTILLGIWRFADIAAGKESAHQVHKFIFFVAIVLCVTLLLIVPSWIN